MKNQHDPYTTSSARELVAASQLAQPLWSDSVREMHWLTTHFGFAIGETGRGGPLSSYAAFTIGLIVRDQQELVVVGLPPEAARLVLVSLARQVIRHGRYFEACSNQECEHHEHAVLVEDPGSDGKEEDDLTVRLRPLNPEAEDELAPGGLYRHPWDEDRRTPMLQVIVEAPAATVSWIE